MTLHRFHVPSAKPGMAELGEAARNHATRVLRLGVGDPLRVFDAGAEFEARITRIEKSRVLIEVGGPIEARPERVVSIHLVMSALKGDLTELVIQKATELGVARLSPAVFERTDTVARREPNDTRLERWHRVAVSASEQSGRAVVPRVDTIAPLNSVVLDLGAPSGEVLRITAAEPSIGASGSPPTAASSIRSIVVAVGPAGGLGPQDLEILETARFVRESFALHTLRSETACLAAVAILADRFKNAAG